MTQANHKRYLKFTSFVIGCFGPIFFLGTLQPTLEPARWTMDLLRWPLDGDATWADPDTRFLSALTGGFLLGWGVTVWCLSMWVYDACPEGVRKSVVVGTCAWFLLDSAGSVAAGAPSNVIFNTAILLLGVGPLWRPAQSKGG
ncbi:MAG: hypothetical protein AAF393_02735 [Pseudomonadota bacterium]